MPGIPDLDDFPYEEQEEGSLSCVPDCVSMVCQFWDLDKSWDEIAAEIGYSAVNATPFENVQLLSGVSALFVASVEAAYRQLDVGRPVIANILPQDEDVLPYANPPILHAVVVVGYDETEITFIDPLSFARLGERRPLTCKQTAFAGAWLGGWVLLPE
jgi:ABC-type bacteriocin/lantibiotic exporter with double-glycine peptidase domain